MSIGQHIKPGTMIVFENDVLCVSKARKYNVDAFNAHGDGFTLAHDDYTFHKLSDYEYCLEQEKKNK